jgi:predicted nuclease of predicted toxin-antitoxin system
MRLLANENIPLASIAYLQKTGYDVLAIGNHYKGISDEEVIRIAILENRTIITFDRDYSELIFKLGLRPAAGVIYLRFDEFSPEFPGEFIHSIFQKPELDFTGRLTVADKNGIRQRLY